MAEFSGNVAKHFVGDRIARLKAPDSSTLACGEGKIVRSESGAGAACRDPADDLHCVSATCTHLDCTVQFNAADTSWDCPCHGSRFDLDGSILAGPAVDALEVVDVAVDD